MTQRIRRIEPAHPLLGVAADRGRVFETAEDQIAREDEETLHADLGAVGQEAFGLRPPGDLGQRDEVIGDNHEREEQAQKVEIVLRLGRRG